MAPARATNFSPPSGGQINFPMASGPICATFRPHLGRHRPSGAAKLLRALVWRARTSAFRAYLSARRSVCLSGRAGRGDLERTLFAHSSVQSLVRWFALVARNRANLMERLWGPLCASAGVQRAPSICSALTCPSVQPRAAPASDRGQPAAQPASQSAGSRVFIEIPRATLLRALRTC